MEKLAYSIKEAAQASSLSRTKIYELIRQGEVTPVKVGGRTLLLRADFEALFARSRAA
ncbi:helix-turn-helix domain-containing protein [Novosphingobium sp. MW5]|nr:helix-turn-helix domain-containing protein [Novosphingobium sp. MW5]